MPLVRFTANHEDLSTYRGYQFKFRCDECRNAYVTRHQPVENDPADVAFGFLDFFGWGRWFSALWPARAIGDREPHADAFAKAVAECKGHFHRCQRCAKWVCPEDCWNDQARQCIACAPDLRQEEKSRKALAMAAAAWEQLLARRRQVNDSQSKDAIAPVANSKIAVGSDAGRGLPAYW